MSYGVGNWLRELTRSQIAFGAIAVVVLSIIPFALGPVQTSLLITVLLFALFATAFNLLYGYTGLLSFGHAMFVAIAAYGTAKVFRLLGPAFEAPFGGASVLVTFIVGIAVGTVLAALLGVIIGYFSVQLEEIYFAMITLSFSMALWAVFQKNISGQLGEFLDSVAVIGGLLDFERLLTSNGSDGLTIPYDAMGEVNLFGLKFQLMNISSYNAYYVIVLLISILSLYALWRIVQSPFGTICRAIRENPGRARALGINTTYHSWVTFIVSATFSGVVGTLFAPLQSNVNPGLSYWTFSAEPVVMTVIGGPYSFLGPLVGAAVYEYLRYGISQVTVLGISLEAHWQLFFGIILVIVVLYFDDGVAGGLKRLLAWLRTARERYQTEGVRGVAALVRTTISGWLAAARAAVRARAAAVGDRLGIGT